MRLATVRADGTTALAAMTDAGVIDLSGALAAVIGEPAGPDRRATPDMLLGYTIGNDVSARDLQRDDGQWVRAKSLDTFLPLGPMVVTPVG